MSKKEIDRKFDQIVEFSGVEEFIDTPVKRYSSGMSARLGFSVAAHVDPEILLVDEVLSVGDMVFQSKCVDKLRELIKLGTTIIFISHNIAMVQSLCQRVILLEKGKMVKDGKPQEVVPYYESSVLKSQESQLKSRLSKIGDKVELSEGKFCHISDVRVCDQVWQEKETFHFEEPLCIQVDYDIKDKLQDIAVQYEIIRADGANCCAGNTRDDNFPLSKVEGKNSVKINLGALPINPGAFYVKISLWDKDMINSYVVQRKRFNIQANANDVNRQTKAVMLPKASWGSTG